MKKQFIVRRKAFRAVLFVLLLGVVGLTQMLAQPEGAVNGEFTINSKGDQVYFSNGNLQYRANPRTWRFAEHQWDYVGSQHPIFGEASGTVKGSDNASVSQSYSGWIDLFGWGTSGNKHGAKCYQPWSTSESNGNYYVYGNVSYNLFDQTGKADWGCNAIFNGGNRENSGWRTLTHEEWEFVFNTRNTSTGIRYVNANVNNVNGVILLPDNWNTSYYFLSNTNNSDASYISNTITSTQWNTLEKYGAVFLPAAGSRHGTSVSCGGSFGEYWSASYYDSYSAYGVYFNGGALGIGSGHRYYGQSVRLVRPAQ